MDIYAYIWGYDVVLSTPEVEPCLRVVGQCNTFKLGDDGGLDGLFFLLVPFPHHKHPPEKSIKTSGFSVDYRLILNNFIFHVSVIVVIPC